MALMYANTLPPAAAATAREYRCWALSQVRYVLGDAGRSLVVWRGAGLRVHLLLRDSFVSALHLRLWQLCFAIAVAYLVVFWMFTGVWRAVAR